MPRAFAWWQQGAVRFLAHPDARRVWMEVRCGRDEKWWHHAGVVSREQLERGAGAGLSVLFRAASRCVWVDERHQLLLGPARCRELLVALDAALEAGLPPRRKPSRLSPPETATARPSGETP